MKYGNGYDLCGPRNYTLLNEDGSLYKVRGAAFSFDVTDSHKFLNADELLINLTSYKHGPLINEDMLVSVNLIDYPDRPFVYKPIRLQYRECCPDDLLQLMIEKQVIVVGDSPYTLTLPIKQ